jgi:hypothetical protein
MLRIEVPMLPGRELSPNYSRYNRWEPRAKARTAWRQTVFYAAVDAKNRALMRGEGLPFIKARVRWTLVYPVNRRRDNDNTISALKVGIDSLVAAAIILDDDAQHLVLEPPVILVDKEKSPLTIIELQEI